MLISCFLKNLEPYGLFIGSYLSLFSEKSSKDLRRYKNSVEFFNDVSRELENFLEIHDYSQENIESWFKR